MSERVLGRKELLQIVREPFPPIQLRLMDATDTSVLDVAPDEVVVEVTWGEFLFTLAVEISPQFHPKAIREAVRRVTQTAKRLGRLPLVLTPYLSDDQLRALEEQGVSGLDLCGNGVVVVPGRLLVYRTGNPNRYPSSSPIRNVYRGTSSLVVRSFLFSPLFETSQKLMNEVRNRGGEVTLSTVSKVCQSLEDDLIISRERAGRTTRLRLLQPEKLLERLVENYEPPVSRKRFTGRCALDDADLEQIARIWMEEKGGQMARTGASSSEWYATMAREPIRRFYCSDLDGILRTLGDSVRETDRFTDIQLIETDDVTAYFDVRDGLVASPLQAYLELSSGDKRERETADQIRQALLGQQGLAGSD